MQSVKKIGNENEIKTYCRMDPFKAMKFSAQTEPHTLVL